MLASKFVEVEVKEWLESYRDETGQKLNIYEIDFLSKLSEKIISSYEKYRYYVQTEVKKCTHGFKKCDVCFGNDKEIIDDPTK